MTPLQRSPLALRTGDAAGAECAGRFAVVRARGAVELVNTTCPCALRVTPAVAPLIRACNAETPNAFEPLDDAPVDAEPEAPAGTRGAEGAGLGAVVLAGRRELVLGTAPLVEPDALGVGLGTATTPVAPAPVVAPAPEVELDGAGDAVAPGAVDAPGAGTTFPLLGGGGAGGVEGVP